MGKRSAAASRACFNGISFLIRCFVLLTTVSLRLPPNCCAHTSRLRRNPSPTGSVPSARRVFLDPFRVAGTAVQKETPAPHDAFLLNSNSNEKVYSNHHVDSCFAHAECVCRAQKA